MPLSLAKRLQPAQLLPALLLLVPACGLPNLDDLTETATDTDDGGSGSTGGTLGESGESGEPSDCTLVEPDDVMVDLTLPAGCYYAEFPLFVDGGTLTMEPGVDIRFGPLSGLSITGTGVLSAVGTAALPVEMHGETEEALSWSGLSFQDAASSNNRLEFVRILDSRGVRVDSGSRLTVVSSEFVGSEAFGLDAEDGSEVTISGSTFRENPVPLRVGVSTVEGVATDNVFQSNDQEIAVVAGQSVDGPATWRSIGIPFHPEALLLIYAPLTLEPGVTIAMSQDRAIFVEPGGQLNATATADAPITFTGVQAEVGFWTGIAYASNSSNNVLEYCVVEYAGADDWYGGGDAASAVYVEAEARFTARNSTFRYSELYGLIASTDAEIGEFENNAFIENAKTMTIPVDLGGKIAGNTVFTDNGEQVVRVSTGNGDTMRTDQTWAALSVPWRANTRFFVAAAWTLEAGLVFEGAQDAGIFVVPEGSLHAAGTANAPVLFTAPDAIPGFWRGISFGSASTSNVLTSTVVEFAGSSGWFGGADAESSLLLEEESVLQLEDVTLRSSAGNGIINRGGMLSCTGTTFEDIAKDDIRTLGGVTNCL